MTVEVGFQPTDACQPSMSPLKRKPLQKMTDHAASTIKSYSELATRANSGGQGDSQATKDDSRQSISYNDPGVVVKPPNPGCRSDLKPETNVTKGPEQCLPALPSGWIETQDPSGRAMFYNLTTKATTWVRPQPEARILPAGWAEMKDPSGRTLYYNVTTKLTTWELPSSGICAQGQAAVLQTQNPAHLISPIQSKADAAMPPLRQTQSAPPAPGQFLSVDIDLKQAADVIPYVSEAVAVSSLAQKPTRILRKQLATDLATVSTAAKDTTVVAASLATRQVVSVAATMISPRKMGKASRKMAVGTAAVGLKGWRSCKNVMKEIKDEANRPPKVNEEDEDENIDRTTMLRLTAAKSQNGQIVATGRLASEELATGRIVANQITAPGRLTYSGGVSVGEVDARRQHILPKPVVSVSSPEKLEPESSSKVNDTNPSPIRAGSKQSAPEGPSTIRPTSAAHAPTVRIPGSGNQKPTTTSPQLLRPASRAQARIVPTAAQTSATSPLLNIPTPASSAQPYRTNYTIRPVSSQSNTLSSTQPPNVPLATTPYPGAANSPQTTRPISQRKSSAAGSGNRTATATQTSTQQNPTHTQIQDGTKDESQNVHDSEGIHHDNPREIEFTNGDDGQQVDIRETIHSTYPIEAESRQCDLQAGSQITRYMEGNLEPQAQYYAQEAVYPQQPVLLGQSNIDSVGQVEDQCVHIQQPEDEAMTSTVEYMYCEEVENEDIVYGEEETVGYEVIGYEDGVDAEYVDGSGFEEGYANFDGGDLDYGGEF